ncbi:MAG: Tim44/TimA family putative adaptor protein [Holosporaceae bacterium]|nr:Tim44/TimA family putative adaptor protein [Holosporaceae bacterium]
MINLVFFICLSIFLAVCLNSVIGLRIGFKIDSKSMRKTSRRSSEKRKNDISEKINWLLDLYPGFNRTDFLDKASKAFGVIFSAYAEGDKNTLAQLLSGRIYDAFCRAIDDRNGRGEKLEGVLVRFIKSEIVDIKIDGDDLFANVKFITEQSNALKNAAGEVLEGNLDYIEVRTDLWTFHRKKSSRDPRWLLYEIKNLNS